MKGIILGFLLFVSLSAYSQIRTSQLKDYPAITIGDSSLFSNTSLPKSDSISVFIGDSWTLGTHPTNALFGFSTLTSYLLNTTSINYGIGGTSMAPTVSHDSAGVDRLWTTAFNPKVKYFFIAYGVNDAAYNDIDTNSFKTAYNTYVGSLLANGYTANQIYIVGPGKALARNQSKLKNFSRAAQTIAETNNCHFINLYSAMDLGCAGNDCMYKDSVHPNNRGHLLITKAILRGINNKTGGVSDINGLTKTNALAVEAITKQDIPAITVNMDSLSGGKLFEGYVAGPSVQPFFNFYRSRGTLYDRLAVSNADILGRFNFYAYDGVTYRNSASIRAVVDGSVSNNVAPADIDFYTGTTTSTQALRMRVGYDGKIKLYTTPAGSATDSLLAKATDNTVRAVAPLPTLASGAFTSTLTNTTNIASSTFTSATYTRQGNVITARITGALTPTASGTATVLDFTLPVNPGGLTQYYAGTIVFSDNAGAAGYLSGHVDVNASSGTAHFISGTTTNSGNFTIIIQYIISSS